MSGIVINKASESSSLSRFHEAELQCFEAALSENIESLEQPPIPEGSAITKDDLEKFNQYRQTCAGDEKNLDVLFAMQYELFRLKKRFSTNPDLQKFFNEKKIFINDLISKLKMTTNSAKDGAIATVITPDPLSALVLSAPTPETSPEGTTATNSIAITPIRVIPSVFFPDSSVSISVGASSSGGRSGGRSGGSSGASLGSVTIKKELSFEEAYRGYKTTLRIETKSLRKKRICKDFELSLDQFSYLETASEGCEAYNSMSLIARDNPPKGMESAETRFAACRTEAEHQLTRSLFAYQSLVDIFCKLPSIKEFCEDQISSLKQMLLEEREDSIARGSGPSRKIAPEKQSSKSKDKARDKDSVINPVLDYLDSVDHSVATTDFPGDLYEIAQSAISLEERKQLIKAILQCNLSPEDKTNHFLKILDLLTTLISSSALPASYLLDSRGPRLNHFILRTIDHLTSLSTRIKAIIIDEELEQANQNLEHTLMAASHLSIVLINKPRALDHSEKLESAGVYHLIKNVFYFPEARFSARAIVQSILPGLITLLTNDVTKDSFAALLLDPQVF